jgi:ParB family chromosome partitioning protein
MSLKMPFKMEKLGNLKPHRNMQIAYFGKWGLRKRNIGENFGQEAERFVKEIPVIVLDGSRSRLEYELMEIDENLMRAELMLLERTELLKRRKEIYEELHPETKWGYASLQNLKQFRNTETAGPAVSVETPGPGVSVAHPVKHKGFVDEISEKTGLSKSLIWEEIQIAKNLTDEVKEMIRGTELADRKMDLLAISRLEPDEQKYVIF